MLLIKDIFKKVLGYIGVKKKSVLIEKLRKAFYSLFDFMGTLLFYFLSAFSKQYTFSKDKIRKILIIRIDRIGDVILSTPAIRAVRKAYPSAELHFLIKEYTKDLVVNNPNIDRLLIYRKDRLCRDYDLAIALHPGIIQNYLTFISGAKVRVGYQGWGGSFFLTHKLEDDRRERLRHEVESALEVVRVVGCSTEDKQLEISVTEKGERFAEDFFQKNDFSPTDLIVAVHPGARQSYIRWKKEGFAQLADRLIREEKAKIS
jgi:ADP-heptose:LPS heptosyltransferase